MQFEAAQREWGKLYLILVSSFEANSITGHINAHYIYNHTSDLGETKCSVLTSSWFTESSPKQSQTAMPKYVQDVPSFLCPKAIYASRCQYSFTGMSYILVVQYTYHNSLHTMLSYNYAGCPKILLYRGRFKKLCTKTDISSNKSKWFKTSNNSNMQAYLMFMFYCIWKNWNKTPTYSVISK